MEHIVHFGISIDDEAIAERIMVNAEKIIVQKIQQKVERAIFAPTFGKTHLNIEAEDILMKWLDDNKEKILELASEALANKMARTKAVRTAIENILEGEDE